jgi:hypothetical protein
VNVVAYAWPGSLPFGIRLFDAAGVAAALAVAAVFTLSAVRNAIRLRDEETVTAR